MLTGGALKYPTLGYFLTVIQVDGEADSIHAASARSSWSTRRDWEASTRTVSRAIGWYRKAFTAFDLADAAERQVRVLGQLLLGVPGELSVGGDARTDVLIRVSWHTGLRSDISTQDGTRGRTSRIRPAARILPGERAASVAADHFLSTRCADHHDGRDRKSVV